MQNEKNFLPDKKTASVINKKYKIFLFIFVFIIIFLGTTSYFLSKRKVDKAKDTTPSSTLSLNQEEKNNLENNNEENKAQPLPQKNNEIKIFLDPAQVKSTAGKTFKLDLKVNTQDKQSFGLDAVLEYDFDLIKLDKVEPAEGFEVLFPKSEKKDEKYLKFSLLCSDIKGFQGEAKAGTLYFTAKKQGQTNLSFLSKDKSTTDTNIASADGSDILESSYGAEIIIEK